MSFFNQEDLNTYIAGIQPKLGTDKLVTFSEYQYLTNMVLLRNNWLILLYMIILTL